MQLIIAGKAHPADEVGQALIHEWINFIRQPEPRLHIVFLSDYDMLLTEHLVQGVDVWINTPRRPWEAPGTSGMKVLVNGGINLSELDGWWAEAYTPEVGWALGDGQEHGDDPAWDAVEADALYDLLEREVVPEFCQPFSRHSHSMDQADGAAINIGTGDLGLRMLVGSDDGAKVYLNAKQVYKAPGPHGFVAAQDTVSDIALNPGLNVLVFKVVNEFQTWRGSIRFTDHQDNPVKGIAVTLDPEGKDLR